MAKTKQTATVTLRSRRSGVDLREVVGQLGKPRTYEEDYAANVAKAVKKLKAANRRAFAKEVALEVIKEMTRRGERYVSAGTPPGRKR